MVKRPETEWTVLTWGKYKGKTLPQILFTDPDWFFFTYDDGRFENKSIANEAKKIYRRSRTIKIPNNENGDLAIDYFIHRPTGKFILFKIVKQDDPRHVGASPTKRRKVIDMYIPKEIASYDKLGYKHLINCIKQYVFNNIIRLTKPIAEDFFSNPNNFEKP